MVSLLPSTWATLPLPNFWWKTRSPARKAEVVPVDLATSSPSMVSGPRLRGAAPAGFVPEAGREGGPGLGDAPAAPAAGTVVRAEPAAALGALPARCAIARSESLGL